jgi:hypothetical protein
LVKNLSVIDVDKRDNWQSSTQANTSNVNFLEFSFLSDSKEVLKNICCNSVPHCFIGLLDLALWAGISIDNLVSI